MTLSEKQQAVLDAITKHHGNTNYITIAREAKIKDYSVNQIINDLIKKGYNLRVKYVKHSPKVTLIDGEV